MVGLQYHAKKLINRLWHGVLLFSVLMLVGLFSGCQAYYTDPYSGQYDPNRSMQTEGFISALYHTLAKRSVPRTVPFQSSFCANASRFQRAKLRRLARELDHLGHPALQAGRLENAAVAYLSDTVFEAGTVHLSANALGVVTQLGERLAKHRRISVTVGVPIAASVGQANGHEQALLDMHRAHNLAAQLRHFVSRGNGNVSVVSQAVLPGIDAYQPVQHEQFVPQARYVLVMCAQG